MARWFHSRTVRELTVAEEEHNAASMGQFYQGEFIDFPVSIPFDTVTQYAATSVTNSGIYNGNPGVWVYQGGYVQTLLLTTYNEFHTAMMKYEEDCDAVGREMIKQLSGE